MTNPVTLSVNGASLQIDPALGIIEHLTFDLAGRPVSVLHRAPWLGEPEAQGNGALAPVERRLSGDFLCAPFGGAGADVPIHGWPANSPWAVADHTRTDAGASATLILERDVQGARVEKTLRLDRDMPMLYQTHRIVGGSDGLSVAHHPMVHMAAGGWLSFSPKRVAMTPDTPLEPGRGWLRYPAQSVDLSAFSGAVGPVDLHRYPEATGHEDFITLVETAQSGLGWTVVIRAAEDDLVLVLKDPAVLPVTMLWYSNGGRDYAPWNGRHAGVLGIEDGCASGAGGIGAARGPNAVNAHGVPTVLMLEPGRTHIVRHVIGAAPRPAGWQRIISVTVGQGELVLTEANGQTLRLPFDDGFFGTR